MIAYQVSIGSLRVQDMDSDGFVLVGADDGLTTPSRVWISHEQLDDLAKLSALVREVNS